MLDPGVNDHGGSSAASLPDAEGRTARTTALDLRAPGRHPRREGGPTLRFAPIAVLFFACAGCGTPPPAQPAGPPPGVRARPLSAEEVPALAQAVARGTVPSPAPELDALAGMLQTMTPDLGLEDLLGEAGPPPILPLQPGDRIEVRVLGRDEFCGEHLISRDGGIQLPLLEPLHVIGRTPVRLAQELRQVLERDYLHRAEVTVRVVARAQRVVHVVGRVANSGVFELPVDQSLTLHGLLSRAQGLAADADVARLALLRTEGEGETPRRRCYHFSHQALLRAHLEGRNVWLEAGDQLVVPRMPDVYVYGAVARPGPIPLRRDATVATILFQAGGLSDDADARELRVLTREDPVQGRRVELDEQLAAGEVIFVPRRHQVYVTGAVARNGALILPRTGLTVLQALTEAGWFTDVANVDGTVILRSADGQPSTIPVPVSELLAGRRSDAEFLLLPGDLVSVPERVW